MRLIGYLAAASLVGVLAGCDLEVVNPNNPDKQRVLRNPSDVEGLAASQYQQIVSGTLGNIARVQTGLLTMGYENSSALNNNGLGPRSIIPRQAIENGRGNSFQTENFNDYRILQSVARTATDVLARVKQPDFSLGTGTTAVNDLSRLKAWSHFVSGVAHGFTSLVYDSAAVARESDGPTDIPALEGYAAVNTVALAQLDSALAYASVTGTSSLPSGWLTGPGGETVTMDRFRQVIRSYKAKLRASVARTPAERAAVDWTAVIADATNGIQSDLVIKLDPTNGWDYNWLNTTLHFRDANWHQMTYYIIGMADVSGAFEQWLATPRDNRSPFLIITPDLRFPQGATRAAQNADRGGQGAPTGGKYFRNRNAGGDQAGTGWQNSQYDHYRFRALADASRVGDFPIFTKTENDMLAAEGYIRTGNIPAAAALIDVSRTRNGLPALAGVVTTAAQPVPGGASCVPRIPVAPNYTTTACGTIMEAMKWEKRMETAYTGYGAWYFDARGWGDLVRGTAISWPVPVQELDARRLPTYNLGGIGNEGGADASTYGYGEGDR